MNWGVKIILAFSAFVFMVLFMVYKAIHQDFSLVTDHYYDKEIKYQSEIDKIKNARNLTHQISIAYDFNKQMIEIRYPEGQIKGIQGDIYFFRPSGSSLDQHFIIQPDESGFQGISVKSLQKGLWQIKVDWSFTDQEYQEEKNITIQ